MTWIVQCSVLQTFAPYTIWVFIHTYTICCTIVFASSDTLCILATYIFWFQYVWLWENVMIPVHKRKNCQISHWYKISNNFNCIWNVKKKRNKSSLGSQHRFALMGSSNWRQIEHFPLEYLKAWCYLDASDPSDSRNKRIKKVSVSILAPTPAS